MLLEMTTTDGKDGRIKCGSCKSEYAPRIMEGTSGEHDWSCPVCGHGKFQEGYVKKGKQILHD